MVNAPMCRFAYRIDDSGGPYPYFRERYYNRTSKNMAQPPTDGNCQTKCGQDRIVRNRRVHLKEEPEDTEGRIVGGVDAREGEIGWQVTMGN